MAVDYAFRTPARNEPYEKPKVSVVITTRNEYPIIYTAIFSCLEELLFWWYPVEIIIVSNCCTDGTPDILDQRFGLWRQKGRLKVVRYNDKGSVDVARNKGVEAATGDLIYISDAHVSIAVGTIHGMIQGHLKLGGMWHTCINCWSDWDDCKLRAYALTLEGNFWGNQAFDFPPWAVQDGKLWPYTVPMAGYAALLIDRKTFLETRGFHPAFKVYAGGESYLSMKLWLLGIKSWLYPDGLVRHDNWGLKTTRQPDGTYRAGRGYGWTNEDIWYNLMLAGYACGGEKWMNGVYEGAMKQCAPSPVWQENIRRMKQEVMLVGEEDRCWIAERSRYPSFDAMMSQAPWSDPTPAAV